MSFSIPFWYSAGVKAYGLGIKLAGLRDSKAKLWVSGRKDWRKRYADLLKGMERPVWIHCASLGEFEQGRPIIEALRADRPQEKIVLTFFSPSGYEVRKNYNAVDAVLYLPLDSRKNAQDFVKMVQPKLAIFIKYENWLHHLNALDQKGIDRYLVSAIFRKGQIFEKRYGQSFLQALIGYKKIFVQDAPSNEYLGQLQVSTSEIAGDTRFDRVVSIKNNAEKLDRLTAWSKIQHQPVLIGGSTWLEDEKILATHWKGPLIIAPHEIGSDRIKEIRKLFPEAQKWSDREELTARVLIIDTIGLLSKIYFYGNAAFIGGGFGKGIHNTLEAAAWGLPVFFGPNFLKFKEAKEFIRLGAGCSIDNSSDWKKIPEPHLWSKMGALAQQYVEENSGATKKIVDSIFYDP